MDTDADTTSKAGTGASDNEDLTPSKVLFDAAKSASGIGPRLESLYGADVDLKDLLAKGRELIEWTPRPTDDGDYFSGAMDGVLRSEDSSDLLRVRVTWSTNADMVDYGEIEGELNFQYIGLVNDGPIHSLNSNFEVSLEDDGNFFNVVFDIENYFSMVMNLSDYSLFDKILEEQKKGIAAIMGELDIEVEDILTDSDSDIEQRGDSIKNRLYIVLYVVELIRQESKTPRRAEKADEMYNYVSAWVEGIEKKIEAAGG